MERIAFWISLLVVSYLFKAVCILMLGQPLRPVGRLLRATTFWFVVSMILLVITLAMLNILRMPL